MREKKSSRNERGKVGKGQIRGPLGSWEDRYYSNYREELWSGFTQGNDI